jgi:hypothetical protein
VALIFPNRSRSFDEARKAVRFLGYDGMFEVPFLVQAEALSRAGPSSMTEADCLAAFDAARDAIYDAARRAYARGRGTLTPADFS